MVVTTLSRRWVAIELMAGHWVATGRNNLCRSILPRREVCQRRPLNLRNSFILRLVVLGVEDGNRIGPRRNSAEHAGRLSILDRRRHAARFAARLAETVGGGIEPAAHGPAVVAHARHRNAQFSRRLRAR